MKTSTPPKITTPLAPVPSLNRLAPGAARWRWMALSGVAAGTAAVTPGAFAEIVQISQGNNQMSSDSNTLRADLTGDYVDEFDGLQGFAGTEVEKNKNVTPNTWEINKVARVFVQRQGFYQSIGQARHFTNGTGPVPGLNVTAVGFKNWINNLGVSPSVSRAAFIPLKFTDSRINKGIATNGLLEILTTSPSADSHSVRLVRLVFDDASTNQPPIGGPGGVTPGGTNTEYDPNKPDIINIINNGGDVNKAELEIDLAILKQRLKKYKVRYKKASNLNQESPRYKLLGRNVKRLQIDIKRLEAQIRNS